MTVVIVLPHGRTFRVFDGSDPGQTAGQCLSTGLNYKNIYGIITERLEISILFMCVVKQIIDD